MNKKWTKADSWYRRDAGEGVTASVSRDPKGFWSWVVSTSAAVLAQGAGLTSPAQASRAADEYLARHYEVVT